ncbi:MAG: TolC family protein [Nitrospirales bacterium]
MIEYFRPRFIFPPFLTLILCGMWSLSPLIPPCWSAPVDRQPDAPLPILRLSLRDAMSAAVDQNPTIQLFRERMTQAQHIADTQLGELLPNLSGRLSGARRRLFFGSFGRDPVVADPDRLYDARALLTQNLFSLSLIHKWRAALTGIDVAGLDTEVTRQNTMATVGLVYLEVLRTHATVDARFADVTLNQQLLRLTSQRHAAGMATLLDVNRAHVRFKNERQRWLVAKNDLIRSKLNLIRAIGLSFDVDLVLIDEMTINPLPEQTLQEALTIAHAHRMELRLQKQKERLASITLSSVTSERIPSLQASGDVGLIGNEISKMLTNDNVQVMMSVPIFDGGQREGRISESRSRVRQEAITTRDVTYQISLEVRDAFLSLHSAQEQVTEAEEGLALSLNEVVLARRRFTAGIATNIEVTDAQAAVATARDNVIEALFNFNVARIQLARAQGRLEDL